MMGMSDDRTNSAAVRDALLAKAKQHAVNAERYATDETTARQRKISELAQCADEIVAAKEAAEADGLKLTHAEIGKTIGWSDGSVGIVLRWRKQNPEPPEVITSGPWDDNRTSTEKSDAARQSAARRTVRDQPNVIAEEALKHPHIARSLIRRLEKGLRNSEPPENDNSEMVNDNAPGAPVLRPFDVVKMGEHVLVVGDSRHALVKLKLLRHAGLPYRREFFYPDAADEVGSGDGEMSAVVVTDPPYGQDKREIRNDHLANWGKVYRLFQPRGGFVFCAFHPPYFRAAEDGIYEAGGEPVEYLMFSKEGGRPWGGGRVQNRLDGLIYFERNGSKPWQAGRGIISSLLSPAGGKEARDELREIAGGHSTPKPINVLIKLIKQVTDEDEIVLDPFTGSGTTLVACQRIGRRFLGVEYEPKWAERAARNWMDETGKDAEVRRLHVRKPISLSQLIQARSSS